MANWIYIKNQSIGHVYIWEYNEGGGWWQPSSVTLLYLPLNSTNTYTDQSGKNIGTTNTGTIFWTYQWVDCGYFDGYSHIQVNPFAQTLPLTVLAWTYSTWDVRDYERDWKIYDARDGNSYFLMVYGIEWWTGYFAQANGYASSRQNIPNQWVLNVMRITSTGLRHDEYNLNGTGSGSSSVGSISSFTPTYVNIWNEWNNWANRFFIGGISELIVENKEWSNQEIEDYFDVTKANYSWS